MDRVLYKALEKRKILQNELAELDRFIRTYRHLLGTNPEKSEPFQDVNSEHKPAPNITKRHGRPVQFARIMEGVLKDVMKPLNRAAMVGEIEARGVEIPSADKPRYVGTILWRERSKFVHIVDHGYWLKYTPLPEIGYDPREFGEVLKNASNIKLEGGTMF